MSQDNPNIDRQAIEQAVRTILQAVGEDPDREGLCATPQRVADVSGDQDGLVSWLIASLAAGPPAELWLVPPCLAAVLAFRGFFLLSLTHPQIGNARAAGRLLIAVVVLDALRRSDAVHMIDALLPEVGEHASHYNGAIEEERVE